MTLEEVRKYEYLVKCWDIIRVSDIKEVGDVYYNEAFKKNGTLRKGWIATNEL